MQAKELINELLPALKSTDNVAKAIEIFKNSQIQQLSIIENQKILGYLSEDIVRHYGTKVMLKDLPIIAYENYIFENLPLLEIVSKFVSFDDAILPVIDQNANFLGLIEKTTCFEKLVKKLSLDNAGGILELQFDGLEYSIAEISRIIETENVKIISIFSTEEYEKFNSIQYLHIKLNSSEISKVTNALSRHGYTISAYFSNEKVNNIEKDRYDLLMKYLSI